MTLRHALAACALLIAVLMAPAARAQSCTRSGQPTLSFGSIAVNPTGQVDGTTNLSLSCSGTPSTTFKVCVGLTNGQDNALSPRKLSNGGSARIDYQVYRDAARSQVWGSRAGTGGAQALEFTATFPSSGFLNLSVPFYGRIFSGQNGLPSGTYSSRMSGSEVTTSYATTLPCSSISGNRRTFRLTANASVAGACSVATTDMAFPTRTALTSQVDATATLSVTCTLNTPYTLMLDGGDIAGNVNNRRMGLDGMPPGVIQYQLYSNSGRSNVWGNTTANDVAGTGAGTAQVYTVYGRVPVQTTPLAGDYEDTVTATVQY